jgi:hypothetical protein
MPRRQIVLAALTLAMTALAACGDSAGPTQPSSVKAATNTSRDVVPTCKVGGWNSSTGRCE